MDDELMNMDELRNFKESVIINYEMSLGQNQCVFIKGKYYYFNK